MKEPLNGITEQIIGAALTVHQTLGPGMLESAYETCLGFELLQCGFMVERQKPLPLVYRGQRMDCVYRLDFLAEGLVIVEVKAVERFEKVHKAQLLSYPRLTGCKVGLLLNFNSWSLTRDGITRIVNGFPD